MNQRFSLERGLALVIFNQYKHIQDDSLAWEAIVKFMSISTVAKIMYGTVYKRLVKDKELKPLTEQPEEHKRELWEAAKKYLPNAEQPERMEFCMSQMGLLWILNN